MMNNKINNNSNLNWLREFVNDVLRESLTDKLYHFTSISSLYQILKDKALKLQHTLSKISDDSSKELFYLSLTRNRDCNQGFSRNLPVRIEFDGENLNQRYSGNAFSYWGKNMGKNAYMNKTATDGANYIPYIQSRTENEDRLYSKEPIIYNLKKYIVRIDVLLEEKKINDKNSDYGDILNKIKYIITYFGVDFPIFFYNNEKDFNYQTKNTVKIESLNISNNANNNNHYGEEYINSRNESKFINALESLFVIIKMNEYTMEEMKPYISNELKKNNIEQYTRRIINYLDRNYIYSQDLPLTDLLNIQELPIDKYKIIMNILNNYCRKRNIHGVKELIKYKKNLEYSKPTNFDKIIENILVLKRGDGGYSDKLVILDVKTTTLKELQEHNYLNYIENIIDNLKYEYRNETLPNSHKSKDDESFINYCKHIFYKKPNVEKIIKIMQLFSKEKQYEIFGCIVDFESIDLVHIYQYEFLNDKEKKKIMELYNS